MARRRKQPASRLTIGMAVGLVLLALATVYNSYRISVVNERFEIFAEKVIVAFNSMRQ